MFGISQGLSSQIIPVPSSNLRLVLIFAFLFSGYCKKHLHLHLHALLTHSRNAYEISSIKDTFCKTQRHAKHILSRSSTIDRLMVHRTRYHRPGIVRHFSPSIRCLHLFTAISTIELDCYKSRQVHAGDKPPRFPEPALASSSFARMLAPFPPKGISTSLSLAEIADKDTR